MASRMARRRLGDGIAAEIDHGLKSSAHDGLAAAFGARSGILANFSPAGDTLPLSLESHGAIASFSCPIHTGRAAGTAAVGLVVRLFLLSASMVAILLRPVRDEMAIQGGVHNLPWMMTGTFVTLLAVTPLVRLAIGSILSIPTPARSLRFLHRQSHRLVCLHDQPTIHRVGRAGIFRLALGVQPLFVVSIFWSLMADLFTPAQGARFFGIIAAGGSSGALFGPLLTTGRPYLLPVPVLMLASAVFFVGLHWMHLQTGGLESYTGLSIGEIGEPLGGQLLAGIRLVWASPYLLGICGYLSL